MKSTHYLKSITILMTLVFVHSIHSQHHNMQDKPSVHGMLLFGQEKIYLSHLPMFHNPHNYQVLFEVELSESTKMKYIQSLNSDLKEKVYTIVPESFILPEMVKNPKTFKAQLYKGHFERGGKPITLAVDFKIKKVLFFKKLKPNSPKSETSPYIIIGNQIEQFLIHTITSKPDFDYITQIQLYNKDYIKKLLDYNLLHLTIETSNSNPLIVGKTYNANFVDDEDKEIELKVIQSIYLEFGDLSH